MRTLEETYRLATRTWSLEELESAYDAAYLRGALDLSTDVDAPTRPMGLLATALPRLNHLSIAANAMHYVPEAVRGEPKLWAEILSAVDEPSGGCLHRCHLALAAQANIEGDDAKEWLPVIYEQTAAALLGLSPTTEPASLVVHAGEALRWAARAIGELDARSEAAAESISDSLAHLLVVCVFADILTGRRNSSVLHGGTNLPT